MADEGNRKDPLTTFLFGLQIPDLGIEDHATAFFKSISGLKFETPADDYNEGGVTMFPRKLINPTKWSNIILKRGFTAGTLLWDWKMNPYRVDGTIVQLGHAREVMCSWHFRNGFPAKWEGPDYDASKNELAIESIEIAHEGVWMEDED